MTFQLRYYQEEAVNAVFSYFMTHDGNPIIAMPTGTGKSIVIAELVRRVLQWYPDQRIQMITHVKTLIDQNFKKLINQWPSAPAGIHSAGLNRRDWSHPIIFGGIQSMRNHAVAFGHVDLLLVDECHLVPSSGNTMYQKYIKKLLAINPRLKVIGFSATPYRLSGGHLCEGEKRTFTHVAYDNTQLDAFNKLIDEGFIAPLVPKRTGVFIEDKGLHTRSGEYIQAELEERVRGDVTERAIIESIEQGHDRRSWLVFAVSIEHANTVAALLNRYGVSAVAYHSKMSPAECDEALAGFVSGKYRAIVSREKLTTGVDVPQIDMIVVLRPTKSPGLWVQMLGRGTRPHPGKTNCLVLDFARNTLRLGPINDPVIPGAKKDGNGGGGNAPVKVCPNCLTYQPASSRTCGYCGEEFPRFLKLDSTASTHELIRKEPDPPRRLKVDHVTYKRHSKPGRPDSLCVTYFCGLTRVQEFIHPDHGYNGSSGALYWWNRRSQLKYPGSLNGIMQFLNYLPAPSSILVDFNGQFPEVKNIFF